MMQNNFIIALFFYIPLSLSLARLFFHSGQTIIFYFKQKFVGIFTKYFCMSVCVCVGARLYT